MNDNYQCKMVRPPKLRKLRSKSYRLLITFRLVEGFTRNPDGTDVPNGINFEIMNIKPDTRRKIKKTK
jgi:hypothetical protein